jgi:hypothetical protein
MKPFRLEDLENLFRGLVWSATGGDREKNTMLYQSTPHDWSYYEVLDGGFSDPAAYLFIGVDTDNNVHVIDGFREKGLSDGEIISRRKT